MFISHDLSTVRAICDEVMILYAGQAVEFGSRSALLTSASASLYRPADLVGA